MRKIVWLILAAAFLSLAVSVSSLAQSGRKRTSPVPPNSPDSSPGKTKTEDDGVTESRVAPGGETIEGDVIRVDTSLITIPVTVMDRYGKYIPQLRRENFKIFEDGVEQKIAYFATNDQPFTVALLIDTSGSTQFRLDDIQSAAITFVSKLKPDDSVMVISFDDRIRVLCKPTTDRNLISRAIKQTNTGGGTRLYDAVDEVLTRHFKGVSGRKAVVLFTDGVDTTSHRASYNSTLRLAEESDAPFYSVDYDTSGMRGVFGQGMPGGRGTIFGIPVPMPGIPGSTTAGNPGDYRRAVNYLHALSDTTGGRFYSGDSMFGIGQAFAWIAEELGRQYSLGYYPKVVGKAGQRRAIKVRVNEPDVVVKARDSYVYSNKTAQATPPDKQPYFSDNRK
ncbi:MAG TPA: VWA domain-containing protein [Pyrinomonadaceae bacterium]|nr:VWA domain-containing protein [Pyrinomonadaceae bacterium]